MNATHNIASDLNQVLGRYQALRKMSTKDVLAKQGGKLGYAIRQALKGIIPEKGSIRAERLEVLAQGGGLRLSKSARKFADLKTKATATNIKTRKGSQFREVTKEGNLKSGGRNWWQIASARELAIRESARGFLSVSARWPKNLGDPAFSLNVYGHILSEAGIRMSEKGGKAQFIWSGLSDVSALAVKGLTARKGKQAIEEAMAETKADIWKYVKDREEKQLLTIARQLWKQ